MVEPERRRSERHPVDIPGQLFLSEGRSVSVRIKNIGPLGALVQIADLEEPVLEGERAVLEHPEAGGEPAQTDTLVRTPCAVVRVELGFEAEGISRELAVYFDGGARPDGYE